MLRRGHPGLQRGNQGERRADLGLCPLGVERRPLAALEPVPRQLQGALLVGGVSPRHLQLILRPAQVEVRRRQLSGDQPPGFPHLLPGRVGQRVLST